MRGSFGLATGKHTARTVSGSGFCWKRRLLGGGAGRWSAGLGERLELRV